MSNKKGRPHVPRPKQKGQLNFALNRREVFKCASCEHIFQSRNHLKDHVKSVHPPAHIDDAMDTQSEGGSPGAAYLDDYENEDEHVCDMMDLSEQTPHEPAEEIEDENNDPCVFFL